MTILLDTTDLGEAEEVLSANYTKMRMTASHSEATRTRVSRSYVGSMTVDDVSYTYEVFADTDPLTDILLSHIRSGCIGVSFPDGRLESFYAGDVMAGGAREGVALGAHIYSAHYDVLTVERSLLNEVAAVAPSRGDESAPVRLTGSVAVSADANTHLAAVIGHVRDSVATNPELAQNLLISSSVRRYLAASMLNTFPNNALLEPTIEDRRDSTPVLLRRAIAFIDDNAHRDISVVDIARAVYVTPRALQYMFRKHRDYTPAEYLRRVRLHHAHLELVAGTHMATTVGQIAARWGFGHLGRFAVYYRQQYGQSPHVTLRE
jgi:AraC-like DNA-binding protein